TAFRNCFRERYWNKFNLGTLQIVPKVAKTHGLTVAEASLRWMHYHGIVIGASSLKGLGENLSVCLYNKVSDNPKSPSLRDQRYMI
ncbi:hypothetical protein BGZ65_007871, partial [Modicella reniformis]